MFTTVAALICVLCAATAATAGGGTGRPAARRDGPGLTIFRIDVSKYPQVAMVVTVPGTPRGLAAADFSVMSGGHASRPWIRQLSPDDIELALAPDAGLPAAGLRMEQAASAGFLVGLPAGAQTGVVNPCRPVTPCRGSRRGISR